MPAISNNNTDYSVHEQEFHKSIYHGEGCYDFLSPLLLLNHVIAVNIKLRHEHEQSPQFR